MQSPIPFTTLCVVILCAMIQCYPTDDNSDNIDVTYDELESLNASCDPMDTCRTNRSADNLEYFNCMCGADCVHLDTCCLDSPFRNSVRRASSSDNPIRSANSSFLNIVRSASSLYSDIISSANTTFRKIVHDITTEESSSSNTENSQSNNNVHNVKDKYSPFTYISPNSSFSNTHHRTTLRPGNALLNASVMYWPLGNTVSSAKANNPTFSNTISSATAKCLEVYGEGKAVYMVDTCSPGWSDDGLVERMCQGNGEDTSDPLLVIPVTSLKSRITYKNYFCGVCNEEPEEYLYFWNIQLTKEDGSVDEEEIPEMFYNDTIRSWTMTSFGKEGIQEPVTIAIKMPEGLKHLVHKCNPKLVSTCSDNWTDEDMARKCSAYMAKVVFIKADDTVVWYRNPHCAICNHEDISERSCFELSGFGLRRRPGGGAVQDIVFVGLFVLEDRNKKCSEDMMYDAFFKKCRMARCGKVKVFRDGECILNDA